MSTEFLLQITSFLIVFTSFLLAFFLFTVVSKNKVGNILLAIYLIIRAVDVSAYFYYSLIDLPNELELLRMDIGSFLEIPFLYLFVLSIIYSDFNLKKVHLLHVIPFLIVSLIQMPVFYLADYTTQEQFADTYLYNPYGVFSMSLAHLQNAFYIVLIFIVLRKYRKILIENYSISNDYNYKWLMQMTVFLGILFVVAIIKNSQKYGNTPEEILPFRLAVSIGMLIFTCWLVLKALYAPKIFTGVDSKILLNKNQHIHIDDENPDITKKGNQLKEFIEENKPFYDSDFTIQKLSEQIQMDTREISNVLNHHLQQNFYEFVNQYRIEEAKKILLEDRKKTILEVLYEVGYNSKSTFNTHFKKSTGYTPTEFRKKYSEITKNGSNESFERL